jgi:tetratricopeptide (TPR) repeat protein
MLKKIWFGVLLILLVLPSAAGQSETDSGENGTAPDEEDAAILEVSPNPVGRGDRFSVTIEVPNPGFTEVEVDPPRLDDSIGLLRGPYIRPFYEYPEEGERVEKSRITYVYNPRSTGRFELGRYRVTTGEESFTTEPRLLEVGVYYQRQLVVPPDLRWNIPNRRVYVGQNLPCILEITGQPEIEMFDQVSVNKPAEGFFQQAPQLGSIERSTLAGVRLYTIPVDGYIFTPSAPGEVRIPPAAVRASGITTESDSPVIRVMELPRVLSDSGAIGDFALSAEVDRSELSVGEQAELLLRIQGTGNLNYLQLPEPQTEGFRVIEEEETADLEPTASGYSGYREIRYTLVAERAGSGTIIIPDMAVMRPRTETIYRLPDRRFSLEVKQSRPADAGEAAAAFTFEPKTLQELNGLNVTSRYADPLNYLWLLPGPLTFFIFLLLRRRKIGFLAISAVLFLSFAAPMPEEGEQLRKGLQAYESEDYSQALLLFEQALNENRNYPGLYYNAALAAYRSGEVGKAVFFSRKAAYLAPGESEYTELLSYIEEQKEFGRRVPLPFPLHPDLLFLTLTILINLAGFLGVIYLYKGRNLLFIGATLALVLALASGVALGVAAQSRSNSAGVVMWEETSALVIPQSASSPAFTLAEGETVLVLGKHAPFYFVENALGQKGWLPEDEIRIVTSSGAEPPHQ